MVLANSELGLGKTRHELAVEFGVSRCQIDLDRKQVEERLSKAAKKARVDKILPVEDFEPILIPKPEVVPEPEPIPEPILPPAPPKPEPPKPNNLRRFNLLIFGLDSQTGKYFSDFNPDHTKTEPDPTNYDTTDFPRKGCRNCGKRDRPQYKGICNDDNCGVP